MSKIKKECPGECCEFSLWQHSHYNLIDAHTAGPGDCVACGSFDMIEIEFAGARGEIVTQGFVYCRDHFGKGRKFSALQGHVIRCIASE